MESMMRLSKIVALVVAMAAGFAQAQTYSVLYNFGSGAADPLTPGYSGMIVQGQDGNLYSTSPRGNAGDICCGTVFKITPAGVVSVLYYFEGQSDGDFPQGGLSLGNDGNFYGTTFETGAGGAGTVFKITPSGTLTTLYSFTGGSDGGTPYAPPIEGIDGNFYGTTTVGGTGTGCGSAGCGTIYKVTPSGVFKVLHQIALSEGNLPRAPLVQGSDGNFYGTTEFGTSCNCGTVFKITPAGKLSVLYAFDVTHGSNPIGPLIQGADGNFYGTTQGGGASFAGEVFKITPSGSLTVLYSMNGTTDGSQPYGSLVLGSDGNFYGTNAFGGTVNSSCSDGCGTVFEVTPKGVFSVLHSFNLNDGATPEVTPFQHTNGTVYGDTQTGGLGNVACGINQCGVFYSWTNSHSLRAFVSLLPNFGKVGATVEILGQGFVAGTTTVSFNGKSATPTVVSGTYLTAKVPSGATSGPVTVTTSGVKLTSNKVFLVTPKITSFTPASGPVATTVTITGVSLTQTKSVTFGGVAATSFTVDSDTQVTATVPVGAKTGHITIRTVGGVAVSTGTFTVT
jgi:uncharacterized repeat protein (TIGR03803 family)